MPKKRDYDTAPEADRLGIGDVITGLAGDLESLRAGEISVQDAIARAMLAKQIFNGFRIYLQGAKLLSANATPVARSRAIAPAQQQEGEG